MMNEIDTIKRAKMYVDKLAKGINPLDDTKVSIDDIVNNARISKCLVYVSSVLDKVIVKGGFEKGAKTIKVPFNITDEQLKSFEYSDVPVGITEVVGRINNLIERETMKHLKVTSVTQWLVNIDALTTVTYSSGKKFKHPTDKGIGLGIISEKRMGQYGEYTAVLYPKSAQQFIIENIQGAVELNEPKKCQDIEP